MTQTIHHECQSSLVTRHIITRWVCSVDIGAMKFGKARVVDQWRSLAQTVTCFSHAPPPSVVCLMALKLMNASSGEVYCTLGFLQTQIARTQPHHDSTSLLYLHRCTNRTSKDRSLHHIHCLNYFLLQMLPFRAPPLWPGPMIKPEDSATRDLVVNAVA
jgi:hypothetical protein